MKFCRPADCSVSSVFDLWIKVLARCNEPATFTCPETLPLDSLLDRSSSHRSGRACAGGIRGGVWPNR